MSVVTSARDEDTTKHQRESDMNREISREDIENAIEKWIIGRNAERDRKILRRRLIDGVKFEDLAAEFDLSVTHTKRIVYKGSDVVFRHI